MDYIILEPWARAAQSLADPMQRLAFWDAIAAFAVDGIEPDPADGIGVMAVAMCRRIIDQHRVRSDVGRKGGKRSGEARANTKQTRSNDEANAKQNEQERMNERMNESSTARTRAVPALKQVLDEAETRNWLSVLPGWTMDDLRAALSLAYAELDRAGWLDRNGNAVKNWRTYLQKVVSEKKFCARAALPFDSVPIGSTEEG